MKTFNQFLTESSNEDELGLHDKKIPVHTKDFKGHAEIKFDSIKRGKHRTHSYRVHYAGTAGPKQEPHSSGDLMHVDHYNGKAYNHKMAGKSSKDLSSLIHKAAPVWVDVSKLRFHQ